MKTPLRVLGVMTGTSCDGIDAVCVELHRTRWRILWTESRGYPRPLRERVFEIQNQKPFALKKILELDRDLGDWYGKTLQQFIRRHSGTRPDLIASHGQTVAHYPAKNAKGKTLQLGDPARVSHRTGITVASHFRDGDLAAGGKGAPLAPLGHKMIAERMIRTRQPLAFQNIGGIGNLTYLSPKGDIIAFDTGPGNLWIDLAVEKYTRGRESFDRGGKYAARGKPDERAIKKLMRESYFKKPAPKSTGRDDFPFEMLLKATRTKGLDLIATATRFTAVSIADAYERLLKKKNLKQMIVCGGGAKNKTLLKELRTLLPHFSIEPLETYGMSSKQTEPLAFAMLGYLSLKGEPVSGPWTGVREFAPPAHLVPGKNWSRLVSRAL